MIAELVIGLLGLAGFLVIALATLLVSWLPDLREVARRKGNSVYVGGDNLGVVVNGLPVGVVGEGPEITTTREVSCDFDELQVDGPIQLEYVQAAEVFLSVTAQENIGPLVIVEAVGGQLRIRLGRNMSYTKPIKINLHGPALTQARLSSGSAFFKFNHVPTFDVTLTGAGLVELEGRADKLALTLAGAGDIDASHMEAADLKVVLQGAGDIRAWASNSVDAQLRGAGDIDIQGSPHRVRQTVHGAGDINIR